MGTCNHETVALAKCCGDVLAWVIVSITITTGAVAQQPAGTRVIEEIVTVGTRTAGRTVTDSPVPSTVPTPSPGGSGLTPEEAARAEVDTDGDGVADRFGPDVFTEVRGADGGLLSLVVGSDGIPDDPTPRFRENLSNPEQIWGEPVREDMKVFINAAVPLGGDTEAYGFANWRGFDADGSFFYRGPVLVNCCPCAWPTAQFTIPETVFPGGSRRGFSGTWWTMASPAASGAPRTTT